MHSKIPRSIFRIIFLCFIFLIAYGISLLVLWNKQIKKGEEHRKKISKQTIRKIRIPARRGRIYSSDGKILAKNIPVYKIVLHLSEMRQPGPRSKTVDYIMNSIRKLEKIFSRDTGISRDKIIHHINYYPGLPLQVFRNISKNEIAETEEMLFPVKGLDLKVETMRYYPYGDTAAHIIGYVGKQDRKKAADAEEYFYYLPDKTGRRGVEKIYEDNIPGSTLSKGLLGKAGQKIVKVDSKGYIYESIGSEISEIPGHDITLTINVKAQKTAEKLMEGKNGAFVLLNADTGAVLAMTSKPSFNPNDFIPSISSEKWRRIIKNPERPLMNRALEAYTPGSIIKPIMGLALLENGFSLDTVVNCKGRVYIGNTSIKCWRWTGHGPLNLRQAIQQSCNSYFTTLVPKIGLDKVKKYLINAGFGEKTGFPFPEKKGLLPSRKAKEKIHNQKWNIFDTAQLAIGQSILQITPLQAALYAAMIGNGGKLMTPYVLKKISDRDKNILYSKKPEIRKTMPCRKNNLSIIKKGMNMVVNTAQGSAKAAASEIVKVYGKTGTAQMGPENNRYLNTWFIGFAEYKNKIFSFAVFVERGKSGGRTCAPIIGDFFKKWLSDY